MIILPILTVLLKAATVQSETMVIYFTYITIERVQKLSKWDCGASLLLAGQPSLSDFFGFALAALRTAVGEVVGSTAADEYRPASRIGTFNSLVEAILAAFFASNRRRCSRHRVKTLLLGFVQCLFAHLILGLAARIITFDPGHHVIGNGIDAAAAAAAPGECNQAGYYQAHNYNTDHYRLFPAVFHVVISKLPNNNMVIKSYTIIC